MNKKTFALSIVLSFMWTAAVFAGTVKGVVTYEGPVPKFRELKMDADPICLTHHTEPVFPDILVLGEGNTMGNIFVHVTSGLKGKDYPVPTEPVVLDQKGCVYTPHVVGVHVGQPLDVLNPDGTLHNVHGTPKINPEFNIAMPKFRQKITRTFEKPEFMFTMKCDVHPWMGAWVAVMEHPFFNVTGKDGQFVLENLPAGQYEIEAWHEKLGTQKMQVTLGEDETKEINFTFTKQ
ncbi:MAG: hypothetical protein KC684_00905 [Candidatus Omnitrophica bacterium]|nr:hypothetical protein [Candidatus Omnitrophota bacterium]